MLTHIVKITQDLTKIMVTIQGRQRERKDDFILFSFLNTFLLVLRERKGEEREKINT